MPQPQAAYDAVLAGILATQSTALSSGCCLRANHRVPVQFIHDIVRRLLLLDLLTADDHDRLRQQQLLASHFLSNEIEGMKVIDGTVLFA